MNSTSAQRKELERMQVLVTTMGPLRRIAAIDEEALEMEADTTVETAIGALIARYPDLAPHRGSMLASIDEEWTSLDATLSPHAHLILMPPVSGG